MTDYTKRKEAVDKLYEEYKKWVGEGFSTDWNTNYNQTRNILMFLSFFLNKASNEVLVELGAVIDKINKERAVEERLASF